MKQSIFIFFLILGYSINVAQTINDQAPIANDDKGVTILNTSVFLDVLTNDINPIGRNDRLFTIGINGSLFPIDGRVLLDDGTVVQLNFVDGNLIVLPPLDSKEEISFTYIIENSNTKLTDSATVNITIIDQIPTPDPVPTPTVSIEDMSFDESIGEAIIPITLNFPISEDIVIDIYAAGVGIGSISEGIDFTPVSKTITIPAGSTTAELSVPILDDTIEEEDEVFGVVGTITSGNTENNNFGAFITIIDNDNTIVDQVPTVSIEDMSFDESIGMAIIPITLNFPISEDIVIDVCAVGVGIGLILEGVDFTPVKKTIIIPAGSTRAELRVPILDDTIEEEDEVFGVLATITSGNIEKINFGAFITILDNDSILNVITNEKALFESVSIYPNPNEGEFFIELNDLKNIDFKFFDSTGKTLLMTNNNTGVNLLNVEGDPGVYYIQLSKDSKKHIFKVLKN